MQRGLAKCNLVLLAVLEQVALERTSVRRHVGRECPHDLLERRQLLLGDD